MDGDASAARSVWGRARAVSGGIGLDQCDAADDRTYTLSMSPVPFHLPYCCAAPPHTVCFVPYAVYCAVQDLVEDVENTRQERAGSAALTEEDAAPLLEVSGRACAVPRRACELLRDLLLQCLPIPFNCEPPHTCANRIVRFSCSAQALLARLAVLPSQAQVTAEVEADETWDLTSGSGGDQAQQPAGSSRRSGGGSGSRATKSTSTAATGRATRATRWGPKVASGALGAVAEAGMGAGPGCWVTISLRHSYTAVTTAEDLMHTNSYAWPRLCRDRSKAAATGGRTRRNDLRPVREDDDEEDEDDGDEGGDAASAGDDSSDDGDAVDVVRKRGKAAEAAAGSKARGAAAAKPSSSQTSAAAPAGERRSSRAAAAKAAEKMQVLKDNDKVAARLVRLSQGEAR